MLEDTHIADGTVVKLLLAGLVVAATVVGVLAVAPAPSGASTVGVTDAPQVAAFPIDNWTAYSADGGDFEPRLLSLDGKGNDPYPTVLALLTAPHGPSQDMDPY